MRSAATLRIAESLGIVLTSMVIGMLRCSGRERCAVVASVWLEDGQLSIVHGVNRGVIGAEGRAGGVVVRTR